MATLGQFNYFLFQLETVDTRFGAQPDGVDAVAATEDLLIGGLWNEHTLGVTPLVAFVVENADHLHHDVFHANILPHRIVTGRKQALGHRGADHGDFADFAHVQRIHSTAEIEGNVFLESEIFIRN